MKPTELGRDRVHLQGQQLVVDAARDMPDWEVRKARRAAIRYRGKVYFVAQRESRAGGRVRYVLEPWPDRSADVPGLRVTYDEEYVRKRDLNADMAVLGAFARPIAVVLTPLVGFLPSRIKAVIHQRFGIHPVTATRWSVGLEWIAAILLGTALCVAGFAAFVYGTSTGEAAALVLDLTKVDAFGELVLVVDVVFRTSSLVRNRMDQDGFYEWLVRFVVGIFRRR